MTARKITDSVSIAGYLAGEAESDVKHEYLAGKVFAMAGETNHHNRISGNVFGELHLQLAGNACQPFNSHTKIRIPFPDHTRFYYPDALVVRESNADDEHFKDKPVVVVEVLGDSTRRTDLFEKRDAYFTLGSLEVLIFVEPDFPWVTIHRRGADGKFESEAYDGLEAVVPLPEIQSSLPLAAIYQRVTFEDARISFPTPE